MSHRTTSLLVVTLLCCTSMLGCSSQSALRNPNFYPNAKLKETSKEEVHQDIRYCMELADRYITAPEEWKEVVKTTATQSVIGGAAGAVGGAIVSNVGRGVGIGAASGAIIGLITSLIEAGEPDPDYERFVEQCLSEKGYRVFSWG